MGEWIDVVVDDRLPTKRRAAASQFNEWWVPLVEKAYAKFNDSYDKISTGNTCRAMTDLTGGVSVEIKTMDCVTELLQSDNDIFNILRQIQHRAVICLTNLPNGDNKKIVRGLVRSHAYSILQLDEVELDDKSFERIIKIRNPWGKGEWNGPWCDGSEQWNHVLSEEKLRVCYQNKNDGVFWMSFTDWLTEFERFSICMLPRLDLVEKSVEVDYEYRVIGTFVPGKNAPQSLKDMKMMYKRNDAHIQILLELEQLFLKEGRFNIWLQFLLDSKMQENRFLIFTIYQLENDFVIHSMLTKEELKHYATVVNPLLPAFKGTVIDNYRHNGFLYELDSNHKYVILATTAKSAETTEECKFMIRAIGPRVTMKELKRHKSDANERVQKRKSTEVIGARKSKSKVMKPAIKIEDVIEPYRKKSFKM